MKKAFTLLFLFILFACSSKKDLQDAQEITDATIAFHGMENLYNSEFSLVFRDMSYTYKMHDGRYEYTRTQTDSTGAVIYDVLNNDGLIRYVNEDEVTLEEDKRAAYARSVNSVIYFFRLPYGLNDAAVIKKYNGEVDIKGKPYKEIEVTFEQSGGGEDFDDVFLYWFDASDYSMDYLAYLYHTDGGGMRFREAINPRRVNGTLVQDYINLKPADEGMDIHDIRELYNQGELEELSRIFNEEVMISYE